MYDAKEVSDKILGIEKPSLMRSREKDRGAYKIKNTLQDIEQAIYLSEGNLTKAAEILNVKRAFLKRKIDATPSLTKALNDVIEMKLDVAEDVLMQQTRLGNVTATTFMLRTLGKQRGYTEKSTVEHELSDKHRTSAGLIDAMRKAAKEVDKNPKVIELKGDEWEERSET